MVKNERDCRQCGDAVEKLVGKSFYNSVSVFALYCGRRCSRFVRLLLLLHAVRVASVFRFWAMAARWNSSRAPVRPLSRRRLKP